MELDDVLFGSCVNNLDVVVAGIVCSYVTMGIDLGNLAALRTFRVLRALKTVAIVPGKSLLYNIIVTGVSKNNTAFILLADS